MFASELEMQSFELSIWILYLQVDRFVGYCFGRDMFQKWKYAPFIAMGIVGFVYRLTVFVGKKEKYRNMNNTKMRIKGEALAKRMKRSPDESKLNWYFSTLTEVILNQRR